VLKLSSEIETMRVNLSHLEELQLDMDSLKREVYHITHLWFNGFHRMNYTCESLKNIALQA